jgi:hypothetical protein
MECRICLIEHCYHEFPVIHPHFIFPDAEFKNSDKEDILLDCNKLLPTVFQMTSHRVKASILVTNSIYFKKDINRLHNHILVEKSSILNTLA